MGIFRAEDKALIKNLRIEKKWGSRKMKKEFPNKPWKLSSLSKLIKKIDQTGGTDRIHGSGRPRTTRTDRNIETVGEFICSQEDAPYTHKSTRQIERETGIRRTTIQRIVKLDLNLKVYKRFPAQKLSEENKGKRVQCCMRLLGRFANVRSLNSIWFTDEKLFTVATPVNTQNDRVYSTATKKALINPKHLLRERSHFSPSVMVSVGVSKMGKTRIAFVEAGAKINSTYYCDHILQNYLLPDIRAKCGQHSWTLQQDGAPSHRAASTITFLQQESISFIEPESWPPNSPDLNPVDYAIWGALQERVYHHQIRDLNHLREVITAEWGRISQRFIIRSIDQWRRRLECVVAQNGGHIEHFFK